jgi:hypothetical protein
MRIDMPRGVDLSSDRALALRVGEWDRGKENQMRLLPGMPALSGPLPYDRDARRRGLDLRVGVALPAPSNDDASVTRLLHTAEHLEAHGVRDLWLGVAGDAPAEPPLASAVAVIRRTTSMRVLVGVGREACADANERIAAASHLTDDRVRIVVIGGTGRADAVPVSASPQSQRQWHAGARAQAEVAAAVDAGWLAIGEEPQQVLQGIITAEAIVEARGSSFPADGVGVLLMSALRRGELEPGQIGATGAASLRTLVERYVAVGVTHFALMPVTAAIDDWMHHVCAAVTGLDDLEAMPCGC